MDVHASTSRRQFFRSAGWAAAGAGAAAVAGRALIATADEAVAPPRGGVPRVGGSAVAAEPAERTRLTGPIAFPFADFERGDLVCLNNFGSCRRNHLGVDIGEARRLETPATLVACSDAVVTQRDDQPSGRPGRFVVLRDGDRWYRYHHLDEIDDAVRVGEQVTLGQRLGTMGRTGNTIWPHLHFEVWVGDGAYAPAGTVLDPVPLLAIPGSVQLDARVCE